MASSAVAAGIPAGIRAFVLVAHDSRRHRAASLINVLSAGQDLCVGKTYDRMEFRTGDEVSPGDAFALLVTFVLSVRFALSVRRPTRRSSGPRCWGVEDRVHGCGFGPSGGADYHGCLRPVTEVPFNNSRSLRLSASPPLRLFASTLPRRGRC